MIDAMSARGGMLLTSLLMKMDMETRMHVVCEDGGETFCLCDMDWGWTVKDCIENLAHSAYEVLSMSVNGNVVFVSCARLPWNSGRYWDEEGKVEYKAVFTCEAFVRGRDEKGASDAALRRLRLSDFDRVMMALFMI